MRIGIVGCGYVADYYLATLKNHPALELLGVCDRDGDRAERFARFHQLRRYRDLPDLLADERVELVVNLTNPSSHYAVSCAALEAGKHVYSEKPLADAFAEAEALVRLAESRGLSIAGAPCNVLGESAQTLWRALRDGIIGTPRLAYAEIEDGPIHLMGPDGWRSESGIPWPVKDELEVGCTLEHAGYYLSWLAAFFGPAEEVTSFSACLVPRKGVAVDRMAPDFAVATIRFASGPVARLTCGIYAPHDHRLRVVGDRGVLSVEECWDYGSRVRLQRRTRLGLKAEKHPRLARLAGLGPRPLPLVRSPHFLWKVRGAMRMDFARGIAELAASIVERRPCRLSARFALHVNEITLAMQNPAEMGSPRRLTTTFEPVEPMPWAGMSSDPFPSRFSAIAEGP